MLLSRRVSWFLLAFGVWSLIIWTTFVKNLWQDGSGLAFDDAGNPTGYFWVHLTLAITSFLLGAAVGGIGLRGVRAAARGPAAASPGASSPADAPQTRPGRERSGADA